MYHYVISNITVFCRKTIFRKDKGSISSKFIDVQEDVEREVNGALEDFGKQLKKAIDEKLTQLKQYV